MQTAKRARKERKKRQTLFLFHNPTGSPSAAIDIRWETLLGFRCSHQTPSPMLSTLWDYCGFLKIQESPMSPNQTHSPLISFVPFVKTFVAFVVKNHSPPPLPPPPPTQKGTDPFSLGRGAGEGSRHLRLKYTINHALTTYLTFFPFVALELNGSHFIT
jgi:hypothetical protein